MRGKINFDRENAEYYQFVADEHLSLKACEK